MTLCRDFASCLAYPRAIGLAIIAALGALSLDAGRAEDYPSRPVRIVVGYGPGASGDIVARILARALSKQLKGQFTIENRPGAGSGLATTYVAHAPADGYTLLQASGPGGTPPPR
jgi:tripartite-type tricarboxylate transporter receptor subunit TctC